MSKIPNPGEIYQHFKGNKYKIITLAQDTETGDMLVIYQAMYGEYKTFARELSMFTSKVDHDKYPNVQQENRFELIIENASQKEVTEFNRLTESTSAGHTQIQDSTESNVNTEESQLDSRLLAYLDADTYEKRLEILVSMKDSLTNDMINTMAVAIDVEIKDGDIVDRYEELKYCLLTREKFECNRLR